MWLIKYKWFSFAFSVLLLAASVFALVRYGLNFGIDFTGGSMLEVEYQTESRPTPATATAALAGSDFEAASIQPADEHGLIIRVRTLTDNERVALLALLPKDGQAPPLEKRFSAIGPALGRELARQGLLALALSVFFILIYIAVAFRGASLAGQSRRFASWKFGLVAIAKLAHDLLIVVGVFAWLGFWRGAEIDALFLAAFLTVLGLSVNDVIAVFDRIRENLRRLTGLRLDEVVGRSLVETMGRSINTSLTVIIVLLSVYFLGGSTTRDFVLAMTVGMLVATYSSVFVASPLLVLWGQRSLK